MTTIKLTNINPDDYTLAIRAAKSFMTEAKPIGIRHGTVYSYGYNDSDKTLAFYVYRTKTMIVVRYSN